MVQPVCVLVGGSRVEARRGGGRLGGFRGRRVGWVGRRSDGWAGEERGRYVTGWCAVLMRLLGAIAWRLNTVEREDVESIWEGEDIEACG